MSLKDDFIRLGKQLEDESNAAFNLWTWLPSYKDSQKGHGDYASEFMPSVADIMNEACCFIADGLNPSEEKIKERGYIYKCTCEEDHSQPTQE